MYTITLEQKKGDNGDIYYEYGVVDFPYADDKYYSRIDAALKNAGIGYNGLSVRGKNLYITVPDMKSDAAIRTLVENLKDTVEVPDPKETAIKNAISDGLSIAKTIAAKPRNTRTNEEKLALGIYLLVGIDLT